MDMILQPPLYKRSRGKALRATIMSLIVLTLVIIWGGEAIIYAISTITSSRLALQVMLTILSTIVLFIVAVPRSIDVLRRYIEAVRSDIRNVAESYHSWVRELEFQEISKKALRVQKEIEKQRKMLAMG